jgi:hypothetical protein
MNDFWTLLVEKVSEFSGDASSLLLGQKVFQEDNIEEKDVYKCLFEKSDLDDRTVNSVPPGSWSQSCLCNIGRMAVHKCCKAETVRSSRSDFSKRHLYTSFSSMLDRKAPQK